MALTYLEQLRAEYKARHQRLWHPARKGQSDVAPTVDGKQAQPPAEAVPASVVPLERNPKLRARMARLECEMKGLVRKALEDSQR